MIAGMRRHLIPRLLALALLTARLNGQTQGEITGEVTDSTGAPMAGVNMTVTNENTNVSRQAITNTAGAYGFPSLLPGVYRVRAEITGFQAAVRSGVQLQVQQTARIDFQMQVGQVNEVVSVSGAAPLLATENATTGTVIENRRIVELPLNGRNYLQLVRLSPNVAAEMPAGGQASGRQGGERANQALSIAGMRQQYNRFTLDGVENTDVNFNTFVVRPSVDALQEFKVQSGVYSAEFGRSPSQISDFTPTVERIERQRVVAISMATNR